MNDNEKDLNSPPAEPDPDDYSMFDNPPHMQPNEYVTEERDAQEYEPDNYPQQDEPEPQQYAAPPQYQQQYAPGGSMNRQQPVRNSQQKRKRKKKRRRSRVPGVLILTTFIFGVSVVLSMVIIGYGKDMLGLGKSDKTYLLVIEEGATTDDIANMLESEGIIRSPEAFKLFSRLRKADTLYVPGEHFIRPNMAYETIINNLTQVEEEELGETVQVTFPEGKNLLECAYILEEEGVCSADDFIFYFNSGGFGFDFESMLPTDQKLKFQRMEGYLFPDTYFFYQDMDPEQVCQKIYLNFNDKMTEERLAKMKERGLTLDQLVTFASIVQKEAATTDVMNHVASVFWNRLNNSELFPLLQSDPTTNYAKQVVQPNMEVLDSTIVNAYDTYQSPGLPPGAICNPGIEAIDAVLYAEETNDYYFIANINTKVTYFAETNEEHEANKAMIEQQYIDEANAAEE
jgi:UPF0755 protein